MGYHCSSLCNDYLSICDRILYAVKTKRIVNVQLNGVEAQLKNVGAIKESTQVGFRPYIQIDLNFKATQIPLISICNAGKGTAISIEITYKIKELEKSKNCIKLI